MDAHLMSKHLLLIDSSGFAYRAFHAGAKNFPRYRDDGMPTGAVLGFLEIIYRMLGAASADPASHVVAVFDAPGRTFRHDLFPAYKGNRGERDPELSLQLPVMRDAARALGLAVLEAEGFEADDLIATMARRGVEAGLRVTIVSSDKDFGQCVRNGHVEIVDPVANKRTLEKDVVEKFGVRPALVPDVQALSGDPVDNIPGVEGIGRDTAAKLIRKLGDLDAVIAEAKKKTGYRLKGGQRLAILKAGNSIFTYRALAALDACVDLKVNFPPMEDLAARPIVRSHLDELLRALQAGDRFRRVFDRPKSVPICEVVPRHPGDPLDWHRKALVEFAKKLKSSTYRITLPAPDTPQCGWYKRRLIQGGPWVPAKIWREQAIDFATDKPGSFDNLHCQVGDTPRNASDAWGWLLNAPITREDYEFMMARREWAKKYAPTEPEANEDKPTDWLKVPI